MSHNIPNIGVQIHCCECGKDEVTQWIEPVNAELIKEKLCFRCHHWFDKILNWEPHMVIVEGHGYSLYSTKPGQPFGMGHGGRVFHVRRFGEPESKDYNNVWHFGEVPPSFRSVLPDTAEFLWPEGPKKVLDRITYKVWENGGNYQAVSEFCGPQPECSRCGGKGEYEGGHGPEGCMPCCSRLFFFIDAGGKRVGADDGDSIEKTDRGLYLIAQAKPEHP